MGRALLPLSQLYACRTNRRGASPDSSCAEDDLIGLLAGSILHERSQSVDICDP